MIAAASRPGRPSPVGATEQQSMTPHPKTPKSQLEPAPIAPIPFDNAPLFLIRKHWSLYIPNKTHEKRKTTTVRHAMRTNRRNGNRHRIWHTSLTTRLLLNTDPEQDKHNEMNNINLNRPWRDRIRNFYSKWRYTMNLKNICFSNLLTRLNKL